MLFLLSMVLMYQNRIDIPDIFTPLHADQVVLSSQGDLFVLNWDDPKIYRFDSRGHLVSTISRRGQGPAELELPVEIKIHDEKLFVTDLRTPSVKVFDFDGKHLDTVAFSKMGVRPAKVHGGWLYCHDPFDKSIDSGLYLTDARGKNPRLLVSYKNEPRRMRVFRQPDGVVYIRMNPAVDNPLLVVARDGKTAWFYAPGQRALKVIEPSRAEITHELPIPWKPERFDRSWGEDQIKLVTQGVLVGGKKAPAKVEPIFPDLFPMVTNFFMDHENKLWLTDYRTLFSKSEPMIMDRHGSPSDSLFNLDSVRRLVGVQHQKAYLLAFDPEEEQAYIIVCHRDEVNAMAHRFPGDNAEADGVFQINL